MTFFIPSMIGFNPAPVASAQYLLDLITPQPVAAWSWARKLKASYNGYNRKIRRSSDNALFYVGQSDDMTNGSICYDIETQSNQGIISSVFSGTDGYDEIIYDQSGNGKNASNPTYSTQPQSISGGGLLLTDSKPSAAFFQKDLQFSAISLTNFTILAVLSGFDNTRVINYFIGGMSTGLYHGGTYNNSWGSFDGLNERWADYQLTENCVVAAQNAKLFKNGS